MKRRRDDAGGQFGGGNAGQAAGFDGRSPGGAVGPVISAIIDTPSRARVQPGITGSGREIGTLAPVRRSLTSGQLTPCTFHTSTALSPSDLIA